MSEEYQKEIQREINELTSLLEQYCHTNSDSVCKDTNCKQCLAEIVINMGYHKDSPEREKAILKECNENAYNAWKGIFGAKEKFIKIEAQKELLDFLENEVMAGDCTYEIGQHDEIILKKLYKKFSIDPPEEKNENTGNEEKLNNE